MASSSVLERYLTPLLAGDRIACREFVMQRAGGTHGPTEIYHELLWPAMERVDKLYRTDRINTASEHLATLLFRRLPTLNPSIIM